MWPEMRWWLVAGWIVGCACLAAAAPSSDEIRDAARTIIEADNYQTEWPGAARDDEIGPGRNRRLARDGTTRRSRTRDRTATEPADWGGIGRVLFWIVVTGLVLFVIVAIAQEVARRRAQPNVKRAGGTVPTRSAPTDAPLASFQRLALDGRFDEALHAIYLTAVRSIGVTDDSWTGREILRKIKLSAESRGALSELTRAVEVSRFGGGSVDEATYQTALALLPKVKRSAA